MERIRKFEENIFLSKNIYDIFLENQLDLVYIYDINVLFACNKFELPTNEYPFVTMKGFSIEKYRLSNELTTILKSDLMKRLKEEFYEYKFPNNYKWFLIKK